MPQIARERVRHSLSCQLREIIESRGLTAYGAAKLAGVDPGVVQRFLTGRRDIRLETADRLAAALGLRLVEVGRRPRFGPGPPRRPNRPRDRSKGDPKPSAPTGTSMPPSLVPLSSVALGSRKTHSLRLPKHSSKLI